MIFNHPALLRLNCKLKNSPVFTADRARQKV